MNASNTSGPDLGRPWQNPAHYRAWPDSSTKEAEVFSGLSPRNPLSSEASACQHTSGSASLKNALFSGIPLLMTGTLTAGVGATGNFPAPDATPSAQAKSLENLSLQAVVGSLAQRLQHALHPVTHAVVSAVAGHIPDTYTVKQGDTISAIASSHGLPTAAVLGLNGLHVNSLLNEGQVLKLTTAPTKQRAQAPPRVGLSQYVIQSGDTLSTIAMRLGISQGALQSANQLPPEVTLIAGDVLAIPGTRATTAPRAIPALNAVHSQSRVVWANAESATSNPSAPLGAQPASVVSVDDGAEDDRGAPDPAAENAAVDPLTVDISPAPTLRVVRPPPPPPPPTVAEPAPRSTPPPSSTSSSSTAEPKPRAPVSGNVVRLPHQSQRDHAKTVIQVGRDLGVSDFGIVIALATVMQESSFRNITSAVDHDSLGLFQQRPHWWGTPEQLTDPAYATRVFFQGVSIPGVGSSRGLLSVSGWQSLPLTVAAQRVQRSAHPDAYAKWEASAWVWLEELG